MNGVNTIHSSLYRSAAYIVFPFTKTFVLIKAIPSGGVRIRNRISYRY